MRAWSVLISADRFAAQRLYHHDVLELDDVPGAEQFASGDQVALVVDAAPPVVVAIANVDMIMAGNGDDPGADNPESDGLNSDHAITGETGADSAGRIGRAETGRDRVLRLAYTQRFFDEPRPAADLMPVSGVVRELDPAVVTALGASISAPRTWLVSLDLPIEASSPAEAVRRFWTYVRDLGPAELPVFVSPDDDELAMQAFVHGDEANQDPEDDEIS